MGGSGDPYLYLIFILPQQKEWWSCQLKPSVNLTEIHERQHPPHLCVESGVFNANSLAILHEVNLHEVNLHEVNLHVCEEFLLLSYPSETLKIFMKHVNK